MKDDLLIIRKVKQTIDYFDKIISNFPNSEYVIKNNIADNMYNILELCYFANVNSGNIRNKYQKEIIVKIMMLDYYFNTSYKKEIITYKKYKTVSKFLLDIRKMMYGWMNYEKKEKFV